MLENKLIKPITTDTDLVELARLLNVQLNGIIDIRDANKDNIQHEGSYIILLRKDDSTGHWVAIHNDEYFDSRMSRSSKTKLTEVQ